jgi:hypothetical protein
LLLLFCPNCVLVVVLDASTSYLKEIYNTHIN